MNLNQFLTVLWARRWLAGLIFFLTVGAGIGASQLLPRKYTASASLLMDQSRTDLLAGAGQWSNPTPSFLSTQIDILTSPRVALQVARKVDLASRPEYREAWIAEAEGRIDFENWVVGKLRKMIDVKPARDSNVVTLAVEASGPSDAAQIANAFAQSYLDVALNLRTDPAKQFTSLFDARSHELRASMEAAQKRLIEFQQTNGVVVTDDRLDIELSRLNELSSQLTALQAIAAESASRQAHVQFGNGEGLQEVMTNPTLVATRADLAHAEARLQELSSRLGDNHPQVTEVMATIDSLRARLATETRRVTGSVSVANSVNRSRETQMRASLEAQRAKVLRLRSLRDEGIALLRDVDHARQAYEGVLGRLNQAGLESRATQGTAYLLSEALPPANPSSPKVLVNTALSLFVGLVLAIAAAILTEMVDARMRNVDDAQAQLGLPFLGVLPKPGGRGGLTPRKNPLVLTKMMAQLPAPTR